MVPWGRRPPGRLSLPQDCREPRRRLPVCRARHPVLLVATGLPVALPGRGTSLGERSGLCTARERLMDLSWTSRRPAVDLTPRRRAGYAGQIFLSPAHPRSESHSQTEGFQIEGGSTPYPHIAL